MHLGGARDFEAENKEMVCKCQEGAPHCPKFPGMWGKKLPLDQTTGKTQDSDQEAEGNFKSRGYLSFSRGLLIQH